MLQEQPNTTPKPSFWTALFSLALFPIATVMIFASQIWFFTRITSLQEELIRAEGEISALRSDVDYVTPLAENANFYAHNHPFSDIRLKTNITPLANSLEGIMLLQGIQYQWRKDVLLSANMSEELQIGLIAQEVQLVFPELVIKAPNGYLTVDYEKLTPILVEAVKEQQILIDDLQVRIFELENNH